VNAKIEEEWMDLDNKVILVTGGTGSFGHKFTEVVLSRHRPKKLIIFSRDELKQFEMRKAFNEDRRLRFFVGDVRDVDRLRRAMLNVDLVIHAAALKRVETCEYNPMEAILTNVMGARNVIEAALDCGVQRVMALSTDKAVSPVNLYGATKLCSEKLFIQSNAYSGPINTRFSCVRYGNVVGSRGSVVQIFKKQRENGRVTVTDPRMTRFWLSLEQGVGFVIECLGHMRGGEVFIPKIPSMNIMDLVKAVASESEIDYTGIGAGEKINEVLISEDESRQALELKDMFVILPSGMPPFQAEIQTYWPQGRPLPDGFRYASDTNTDWLSVEKLKELTECL
jgi:UDP-N-acetylglucosamine 4,6-dehydratase (inverting)